MGRGVITREELQRNAGRSGVRVQVQERDYVLGWFLLGLIRVPGLRQMLAFKGGTALRKMYLPSYRFSEDLDFTLGASIDEDELRTGIASILQQVERISGLQMSMAKGGVKRDVADEEAYQGRVAYVGPFGQSASPPRIRLDLTRYECLVLPMRPMEVTHPYSDVPADTCCVATYPLEEMLAEKLRALLRRCYPRDVYDVWYLLRHHRARLDRDDLHRALEAKCRYKGYTFSSSGDFLRPARRSGMAEAWDASLQHLISAVPSHESVVEDLADLLRWLWCGGEWDGR